MTGVVCNCYALVSCSLLDNIICKSLGSTSYNVNIHTVGACTDDAAQARGTELQGHSKTVLNGGIVTLDAFQLGLEVSVVQLGSEPTLIHILIHK